MRRTTSLTAACLASLAPALVLLTPASAGAAGESCRGEAATIVGERGKDVVGTEGRDVIVTNRSQDVKALGGDDLICVTGPDAAPGTQRPVQLDAGPGDDLVDGTAARSWPVDGYLGTGSDRFEGGAGDDSVHAGPPSFGDGRDVDAGADVLLGGAGRDYLSGGSDGLPNSDVLDAGDGDDSLGVGGSLTADSSVDGGAGRDHMFLPLAAGENTVDNGLAGGTGELRHGATVVRRWTGLEAFFLNDPETGTASVSIAGGPEDESFSLSGDGPAVVDLGSGDDHVSAFQVLPSGSTIAGGPGSDGFAAGTEEHDIAWDLAGDAVRVGDAWTIPATGFENTFLAAPRIEVSGTDEDNRLSFVTCELTVRGRGGDDSMWLGSDHVWEEYESCGGDTVMVGGAGDDRFSTYGQGSDRLVGGGGKDRFEAKGGRDTVLGGGGRDVAVTGPGNDRFVGGPGRDRVDGEQGRDRCDAERERRCER